MRGRYRPKEGFAQIWRRIKGIPKEGKRPWRHWPTEEKRAFTFMEAWFDLLLRAAYKPHAEWFKGKEYHLRTGELVTSQRDLADYWGWSRGKVRRALEELYEHGEAAHRTDQGSGPEATVITIYKLMDYPDEDSDNRPTSRPTERTTIEEGKKGVQEPLSSNRVQNLVHSVLDKMGRKKDEDEDGEG